MFNIYFKEMKKFFSLIALVGVIAACTPEQVETAFKLAGGKVLVNVEVVDIINGGTYSGPVDIHFTRGGLDITSEFTQIVGSGPHAYSWQAAESQAVAAGDYGVIVKGEFLAKDYTSAFVFPEVLAGGMAAIRVIVPVGEPLNGYTCDTFWDVEDIEEGEDVGLLENKDYKTYAYSHAGIDTWYYNNTEYILEGNVTGDDIWWKYEVSNVVDHKYVGFEGVVDNLVDYWGDDEYIWPFDYKFYVSAWAMWNIRQINYWEKVPMDVIAWKDADEDGEIDENEKDSAIELGSFDVKYTETVSLAPYELPYPGAAGHYHYGHGHDAHGTMPNAGGGISFNE
jgi:hypothetical protein